RLALDFGSGALLKLQTYMSVSELNGIVLSHYHTDHIADIGVLQHERLVNSYITDERNKFPIYGHAEDELHFSQLQSDYTEALAYNPDEKLILVSFTFHFLRMNHSVPCFGMRVRVGETAIVYTADTAYIDSSIEV